MTAQTTRPDVYTRITADIVAQLEAGVRPWHQPWNAWIQCLHFRWGVPTQRETPTGLRAEIQRRRSCPARRQVTAEWAALQSGRMT